MDGRRLSKTCALCSDCQPAQVSSCRTILADYYILAETFALLEDEPLLVDVIANEDCRIVFLRVGSSRNLTAMSTPWARRFAANVLMISALKNLHLSGRSRSTLPVGRGRIEHMRKKFVHKRIPPSSE